MEPNKTPPDASPDPASAGAAQSEPLNADHAPGSPAPDTSEPVVGAGRAIEAAYRKNRQPQQQQAEDAPAADQPGADQPAPDQQQTFQGAGYPAADQDGPEPAPEDSPAAGTAIGAAAPADPSYSEADEMVSDGVLPDLAPVEDGPSEEEPGDTSIVGQGHVDKAAWNRERTSHPQPGYDAVASAPGGRTPGSSEDMGYGGGAPDEDAPGLETGDGILDDLSRDPETDADEDLEDAADDLDNPPDPIEQLPKNARGEGGLNAGHAHYRTFLPEHRDQSDEDRGPEELLIADENEDATFAAGELGDTEDLEMEDLNETDDISQAFEDQRADLDDAASGNERQAGV